MFLGVSDAGGKLLLLIPRASNTTAMGEGLNDVPILALSIITVVIILLNVNVSCSSLSSHNLAGVFILSDKTKQLFRLCDKRSQSLSDF